MGKKKPRVGWDISINRAASSLMKRIPAQWGNCNLQVTVAVNSISTYFGLADPLKTPPPCPDVNGNTRAHKSNTVVNQQATGGRSRFSNTVGKTPQNLTEQGEFLQAWFGFGTPGYDHTERRYPLACRRSILTQNVSPLLSAMVQTYLGD